MTTNLDDRFWSRVDKTNECWVWIGKKLRDGYGQQMHNGKTQRVHRIAWEAFYGPIPAGLWVLHQCDNPSCVRPDHLFLGANTDNARDCARKGRNTMQQHPEKSSLHRPEIRRAFPGEQHPNAKLTEQDIKVIRQLARDHFSQYQIARLFNISRGHVQNIIKGLRWGHIPLIDAGLDASYYQHALEALKGAQQ